MSPVRRRAATALKWLGYAWCLLNLYLWTWAGEWGWTATWTVLGFAYCWLIARSPQPRPVRARPDYARIARLERELGIDDSRRETP